MPEGPDGSEYGPASQFIENLDYYEAIGAALIVRWDDDAYRFAPGENLTPEAIEEVSLGYNVRISDRKGISVEQVRIDGKPLEEIVQFVDGGFTFAEQQQDSSVMFRVNPVIEYV